LLHLNHVEETEDEICKAQHVHDYVNETFKSQEDADWFIYNQKLDVKFSIRQTFSRKKSHTRMYICGCSDLRYKVKHYSKKTHPTCTARFAVKTIIDDKGNVSVTVKGMNVSKLFFID
jgi:hypothetical protein